MDDQTGRSTAATKMEKALQAHAEEFQISGVNSDPKDPLKAEISSEGLKAEEEECLTDERTEEEDCNCVPRSIRRGSTETSRLDFALVKTEPQCPPQDFYPSGVPELCNNTKKNHSAEVSGVTSEHGEPSAIHVEGAPPKGSAYGYAVHKNVSGWHNCDLCALSFSHDWSLDRHIKICHATEKHIESDVVHSDKRRFACSFCRYTHSKKYCVRVHMNYCILRQPGFVQESAAACICKQETTDNEQVETDNPCRAEISVRGRPKIPIDGSGSKEGPREGSLLKDVAMADSDDPLRIDVKTEPETELAQPVKMEVDEPERVNFSQTKSEQSTVRLGGDRNIVLIEGSLHGNEAIPPFVSSCGIDYVKPGQLRPNEGIMSQNRCRLEILEPFDVKVGLKHKYEIDALQSEKTSQDLLQLGHGHDHQTDPLQMRKVLDPRVNFLMQEVSNVTQACDPLQPMVSRDLEPLQPMEEDVSQDCDPLQPVEDEVSREHDPLQPIEDEVSHEHRPLQPIENEVSQEHDPLQSVEDEVSREHDSLQPVEDEVSHERGPLQPIEDELSREHDPLQPIEDEVSQDCEPLLLIEDEISHECGSLQPIEDEVSQDCELLLPIEDEISQERDPLQLMEDDVCLDYDSHIEPLLPIVGELSRDRDPLQPTDFDLRNNFADQSDPVIPKKARRAKSLACDMCGKMFPNTKQMDDHKSLHHPKSKRPYSCDLCPQRFSNKCIWKGHKKGHSFVNSGSSQHKNDNSGKISFECPSCDFETKYKRNFARHILLNHSDEGKSYRCASCDYKTGQKQEFNRHVMLHAGKSLFACDVCDALFAQKKSLSDHFTKKHGERYKCSHCDYRTKYRWHLSLHASMHACVTKFECPICGHRTTNRAFLGRHMRVLHFGEQPLRCSIGCSCAFTTYDKNCLRAHVQRHVFVECGLCRMKMPKEEINFHMKNHMEFAEPASVGAAVSSVDLTGTTDEQPVRNGAVPASRIDLTSETTDEQLIRSHDARASILDLTSQTTREPPFLTGDQLLRTNDVLVSPAVRAPEAISEPPFHTSDAPVSTIDLTSETTDEQPTRGHDVVTVDLTSEDSRDEAAPGGTAPNYSCCACDYEGSTAAQVGQHVVRMHRISSMVELTSNSFKANFS